MTDAPTCATCDKPTPDGEVCSDCADRLERLLERLPGYMAELELVVSRQTKAGPGGARGVGHEFALPFAESASHFVWAVGNTVATWARAIVQARYVEPARVYGPPCWWVGCEHHSCAQARRWLRWQRLTLMPITPDGLYRWLAGQVEWLRHQPIAAQAFGELLSLDPAIKRWLDSRGWASVGTCRAVVPVLTFPESDDPAQVGVAVVEQACGTPLRLYEGADTFRCRACGAEYDAQDQDMVLLLALRGQNGTAAEISRLLAKGGKRVSAARIRQWAHRRQIQRVVDLERGAEARYWFGDVLDRLDAAKPKAVVV